LHRACVHYYAAVEIGLLEFCQRAECGDAGAIECDIEPTELANGAFDKRFYVALIGDIRWLKASSAAVTFQPAYYSAAFGFVPAGNGDFGPGARVSFGNALADAARSARDDSYFTVEPS
jgi:hypothetical protein